MFGCFAEVTATRAAEVMMSVVPGDVKVDEIKVKEEEKVPNEKSIGLRAAVAVTEMIDRRTAIIDKKVLQELLKALLEILPKDIVQGNAVYPTILLLQLMIGKDVNVKADETVTNHMIVTHREITFQA